MIISFLEFLSPTSYETHSGDTEAQAYLGYDILIRAQDRI